MTGFTKFETILIITICFLIPILIFSGGIVVLFQTNFSGEGFLMSAFPFALGITSFFALNLHKVFEKE